MKVNSVIVGIQYHKGVEALNKGDEVKLSFNGADDEYPTGIRVLTNDGVVIGNIINNMNHPSLDNDVIYSNDIKNNNAIRRITTTDCKATVVAIKRYIVFITINTEDTVDNEENKGDNMIENLVSKMYDEIEEEINSKIGDNNYFEVFDNEIASEGWIVIKRTEENVNVILKIVEDTIEKFDGVSIFIDDMPTDDVEFYYSFDIKIEEKVNSMYNKIEEEINSKIGEKNYFEVFDDELTSDGWIVIKTDEEEEILQIVKDTINKFDGVSIKISNMPTYDVEYYYNFTISLEEEISSSQNNLDEDGDENMEKDIEKTYVKEMRDKKEIDELDEATWSIFTQCDEISAKGYFKDNLYIVEAYYEDRYLCEVCERKLKALGFKEANSESINLKERIKELEENIEKNKEQNRKLRKERVTMKKQLKQLKEQLKNNANEVVEETTDANEGESMEEKIKEITKETITQSVMEKGVKPMVLEMQQRELLEAFNKAKADYPIEVMAYTTKYLDIHPIANTLLTLRAIDDLIAQRYLKGDVSGGEFDYVRVHIGIHSYFYYEHLIEEVTMDEFFTSSSLEASKKFLKEEEEREKKLKEEMI